ncbi:MAG: flagellar hook-associated protein FlgK, partial [Erysipelotrichaceae bacterium]
MRSTFLGFETARKGMAASQKGIDITGQNITNMNTSGYTRQRVDFVSVSAPTNARYRSVGTSNAGQGVNMGGVSQIRNPYLDARFRSEFADTGYHDKALSILDGIESVLNEVEGGLKPVFNDLLAALQDFSSKPDQVTNANIVLSSVKSVTQMIRSLSKQLDTLGEQYVFDLTVDVKNVNALMEKITDLNKSISESVANQTNPSDTTNINELLDQRNLLLDELGQYGNIRVIDQGDGTVSVEMNEHKIIDGTWHEQINLSVN